MAGIIGDAGGGGSVETVVPSHGGIGSAQVVDSKGRSVVFQHSVIRRVQERSGDLLTTSKLTVMRRASSAFEAAFSPDVIAYASGNASEVSDPYLGPLLAKWGGTSFNGGIYRLVRPQDIGGWFRIAEGAFPSFRDRLLPFGIDWLGRLFALDLGRTVTGSPAVTLLEPGTGEALEIPCTAESFHESELIEYREESLAASFLEAWLRAGGSPPALSECVAYRQPLFLGGSDTVENLELADLHVYWGLAEQLIRKVRGLPTGTVVNEVSLRNDR